MANHSAIVHRMDRTRNRDEYPVWLYKGINQAAAQQVHPADAPAGAIEIVRILKTAFPIY
jgi:hypothetical protein